MRKAVSLLIALLLLLNPLAGALAEGGIQAEGETVNVQSVVSDENGVEAKFNGAVEVSGTVQAEDIGVSSTFGSEVAVGTELSALENIETIEDVEDLKKEQTAVTSGDQGIYISHESSVVVAGDVVVNDPENAAGIYMYNDEHATGENYAYVAGDVDVTGGNAIGIHSDANKNTNNVIVSGDVSVTANDTAVGIETTPTNNNYGTSIEIGGNLTVEGAEAIAVDAQTADVVIDGTVTSDDSGISSRFGSEVAVGVDLETLEKIETVQDVKALETGETVLSAGSEGIFVSHESSVLVAGDVEVEGTGEAAGIWLYNDEYAPGENYAYVAGDVDVTGENAVGIHSEAIKNTNNVIVSGDVSVTANDTAVGIETTATNNDYGTNIEIGGNLTVEGSNTVAVDAKTADVVIAGTVTSDDSGISSRFGSEVAVGTDLETLEKIETAQDVKALETGETVLSAGSEGIFVSHESSALVAGNVEVKGTGEATGIELYNDEHASDENYAYVAGDVTVTGNDVTGVSSSVSQNVNNVIISGDLTAEGEDSAVGIETNPGNGKAVIEIGGNLTVTGDEATAIDAGSANVVVGGTVSSTGDGVSSRFDSEVVVGSDLKTLEGIDNLSDVEALGTGKPAVTAVNEGIFVSHGSSVLVAGDTVVNNPDGTLAIGMGLYHDEHAEKEDSAMVAGDLLVSAAGNTDEHVIAKGAYSTADNSESDLIVFVSGDVAVKAVNTGNGSAFAEGIELNVEGGSDADTVYEIGGALDVSAIASSDKDASAIGIRIASRASEDEITIGGPVTVSASNEDGWAVADGISASVDQGASLTIAVNGDIAVTAKGSEEQASSVGLNLYVMDGTISAAVDGSITAGTEEDVYAAAIQIVNPDEADKATVDISVTGDVKSGDAGLYLATNSDDVVANVLIEGELKGENAAIVLDSVVETPNLNLTVYKVELNTIDGEEHAVAQLDEKGENLIVNENTAAVEQAIQYIIKVEPNDNGAVSADRETAKEGETVTMRISANDGYHVVAAYNGEGQQVPLLMDASGNYYVEVPRGGGVYLSARIDRNAEPDYGEEDDEPRNTVVRTVTPQIPEITAGTEVYPVVDVVIEPETVLLTANEEQLAGEQTVLVLMSENTEMKEEDREVLSSFTAEEQMVLVLKQAGLDEIVNLIGLSEPVNAQNVLDSLTTDLSSAIVETTLTVSGEESVWNVISIVKNGVVVRYAFRQKADGTWEYIMLTDDMLKSK